MTERQTNRHALVMDSKGRFLIEEEQQEIIGRYFKRRKAVKGDDAANLVRVAGTERGREVGQDVSQAYTVLVIQSATFGAVGKEWDGDASVTYDLDDFDAEYERVSDAVVSLEAKRQTLDGIEATQAFRAAEAARRAEYSA